MVGWLNQLVVFVRLTRTYHAAQSKIAADSEGHTIAVP